MQTSKNEFQMAKTDFLILKQGIMFVVYLLLTLSILVTPFWGMVSFGKLTSVATRGNNISKEFDMAQQNLTTNSSINPNNDHSVSNNSWREPFIFQNPLLINSNDGCSADNLNLNRFDDALDLNDRLNFCGEIEKIIEKLNGKWSPELQVELEKLWQVFQEEKIIVRPINKDVSGKILAIAEAFTEKEVGSGFKASLFLRPQPFPDQAYFAVFMHELRHIFDFYELYRSHSNMTGVELEKRGFRIMGKISQESSNLFLNSQIPTFWEQNWNNLTPFEIEQKRDAKILKFMKSNSLYKRLLKSPENYLIGYISNQFISPKKGLISKIEADPDNERLPTQLALPQTNSEIPQNVKELNFNLVRAVNSANPTELLNAALENEKKLFQRMDNFVYEENLSLQCWKKEEITQNYESKWLIARTQTGETLVQDLKTNFDPIKRSINPQCVQNFNLIQADATETFWAAPYLDQMPIKFELFTQIEGIPVARYTVLQPTPEKYYQIVKQFPQNKIFRAFVGTIFVSVKDSQIIRFWGTSFPELGVKPDQSSKFFASYCATAIRQKLSSGIWVTTLLNAVAVTKNGDKLKPFSYLVKYQNYRQGESEFKVLEENEVNFK